MTDTIKLRALSALTLQLPTEKWVSPTIAAIVPPPSCLDRRLRYETSVAQHRHPLADLVDLFEIVRDEQEGHACSFKRLDMLEFVLECVGSSRMMNFAPRSGAGDFQHLPLAVAYPGAYLCQPQVPKAQVLLDGLAANLIPTDHPDARTWLVVEKKFSVQVRDDR